MKYIVILIILCCLCCLSCQSGETENLELRPISFKEFAEFIAATNYKTDAEKYGWSIIQQDVYNYTTAQNATWRVPDGITPVTNENLPVTQVSYKDAKAYCQWAGVRLPTYDEYWELVKGDSRTIATENIYPISPVGEVNIIGNVWDITEPIETEIIRLAGGSIFCSRSNCNGSEQSRVLEVDKETGNIHIGFSVVVEK